MFQAFFPEDGKGTPILHVHCFLTHSFGQLSYLFKIYWQYSLEDEELPPGSQAIVYVAKDNLTSKTMALKKIALAEEGEIPTSVIREASLLLDLRHDNIVR